MPYASSATPVGSAVCGGAGGAADESVMFGVVDLSSGASRTGIGSSVSGAC